MLAHDTIEVDVVTELRLRVPRSAPGDVFAGTRDVVEGVDAVTQVSGIGIASITPNLNDLFVEASVAATLRFDAAVEDPDTAVRSALLDGFGVDDIRSLAIEQS